MEIVNGVKVMRNPQKGMWEGDSRKRMTFVQELSLGVMEGDERQAFYRVRDVEVDCLGNIFILDAGNFRIVKFSPDGDFLWQRGKKGDGPGEFKDPVDLTLGVNGDYFVLDHGNARIDRFAANGEYLSSINLRKNITAIAYLPSGKLLATENIPGIVGSRAHIMDLDGESLLAYQEFFQYGQQLPEGVGVMLGEEFQVLRDGQVYLSTPFPYEIWKFDTHGKLLMKIKKESPYLKPPDIDIKVNGDYRSVSFHSMGRSGPCYLTPDGLLVNSCWWMKDKEGKERESTLDFFDEEGRFLRSYPSPVESGYFAGIDELGKLYFLIYEPYPRVVRYSFHLG
ncbi:MAG: 6-bladed beta-propeller [bacterium]